MLGLVVVSTVGPIFVLCRSWNLSMLLGLLVVSLIGPILPK